MILTNLLFVLISLPEWAQQLKPSSHMAIRYEEAFEDGNERSGLALGLSAGVFPRPQPYLETGIELSLSENTPGGRPNLVPLSGGMQNKSVALSQAYLAFDHRENFYRTTLSLGKFFMPFAVTPLTWDTDIRPEGAYESIEMKNRSQSRRLRFHSAQLAVDRVNPSLAGSQELRRSYLFLTGVTGEYRLGDYTAVQLSGSIYWFFQNSNDIAEISLQRGNSVSVNNQQDFSFDREYRPFEFILDLKSRPLGMFSNIRAAFAMNTRTNDKQRGFFLETQVGRPWEAGKVLGKLAYLYIEPDLQLAAFLDDEWGYGNRKGFRAEAAYFFSENLKLSSSFLFVTKLKQSLVQNDRKEFFAELEYRFW